MKNESSFQNLMRKIDEKGKSVFTIMVLPDQDQQMKTYKIRYYTLYIFIGIAVFIFITYIFSIIMNFMLLARS